jgi:lipopolysaccharide transport system ATP-binding protein
VSKQLAKTGLLVQAHGLGKSYPKVFHRSDRLRALLRLLAGRSEVDATTVLHDINLEVWRGQSVGLIGENGAGKSTLLKLISGVLTPSSGNVKVHGRIGALLELGAGFHPEYSGRENIAMSAALYGLSSDEIRQRLPEIIEFADIGHYIDEPVKHYSSGMVVRLGFAVVAATRPDLLITDEVLAVGDESFQKKCVRWIEEYLENGGTLLLVSHSMYHIQKLCKHAIWLKGGVISAQGDVFDVTQAYLSYHERKNTTTAPQRAVVEAQGMEFHLLDVWLNDESHEMPLLLEHGDELRIRTSVHSRDGRTPVVMLGIVRADSTPVYGVSSDMDSAEVTLQSPGSYIAEVHFPALCLLPGGYTVRMHALDTEGVRLFDTIERGLTIRGNSRELGMVRLPHRWITPAVLPNDSDQRAGTAP